MSIEFSQLDSNITRLVSIGDFDATAAENFLSQVMPLLDKAEKAGKKFNMLFITTPGKVSVEGRRAFSNANKDKRVGKIAVVNKEMSRIFQMLARFVMIASGKNNIKFFEAEDQALEWLKG